MVKNKTRDGIKLSSIIRALESIPEISLRPGANHKYVAIAEGYGVCPIAASTDARRMVVPWLSRVTGNDNRNSLYQSLRKGKIDYNGGKN